jgi:glycosyltransferase involved in cell wall biosynthesis
MNCVDENKFSFHDCKSADENMELREKLGLSMDEVVVLYVGRIAPVKGVLELLEAIEQIEDVRLLLIGRMKEYDMDYVHQVERKVADLGDKVKALGYVPNDELYRYYRIADMQVIPSMWEEGAGLVAIEGMYASLPLIVTDSGGLVEYVSSECALIAKRADIVNELIEKISVLKENADQRSKMGQKSLERAKYYTKKKYYHDFLTALGI